MSVTEYLKAIEKALSRGDATEHTYRSYLQAFLESRQLVDATNEPKREKCGAPDYVISRRKDRLTIGYVEAKDIDVDLTQVEDSEQLRRYRQHLPNLLLTDYLEVRWFVQRDGKSKKEGSARLGRVASGGKIVFDADEQAKAIQLIDSFLTKKPLRIISAHDLAVRLAHFTHLIRDIITEAYGNGAASQQLRDWRAAFAATLLPELDVQTDKTKEKEAVAEFADMFAQTLAYGLFSARAASPGGRFSREQARKLIPRTNPFLRTFFEQITGTELDDEPFAGFVDDIIQTLAYADIDDILRDFGKRGRRTDPVVHFYETFLHAYDPKLRELRGVYYTPEPVVNYIVESIDHVLKEKFGLKNGLADRSKITVTRKEGEKEIREESHRVLILDPATGTATFLYRVLDFIRGQFERKRNLGAWGDYVHEHLLPRLFGFELLMAPYAVAHFKLGLALAARDQPELWRQNWSYEARQNERINVFLTNTLEDLEKTAEQLGPLRMLSNEANSAYEIKKSKPVLVVLGNPPYSNFGRQNRGEWILGLLDDYKSGLNEKKININDDFIKFIRWAQWRIEQTGQGVIGYITNNIYLDGPTHRRMRQSLLGTFDEIYIVNLHGSAKKHEKTPEGGKDENVFDITLGVAIVVFAKLPKSATRKHARTSVHYRDLWGLRADKYKWLDGHDVSNTDWKKLSPVAPGFFFVPRTVVEQTDYKDYWSVPSIFPVGISGIKTHRDQLLIAFDRDTLVTRFKTIAETENLQFLKNKFEIEDTAYWTLAQAKQQLNAKAVSKSVHDYCYRPFDERFIFFEPKIIERGDARWSVMRHMLDRNLALVCTRQTDPGPFSEVFATTRLLDKRCLASYTGEARLIHCIFIRMERCQMTICSFVSNRSGRSASQISVPISSGICVND